MDKYFISCICNKSWNVKYIIKHRNLSICASSYSVLYIKKKEAYEKYVSSCTEIPRKMNVLEFNHTLRSYSPGICEVNKNRKFSTSCRSSFTNCTMGVQFRSSPLCTMATNSYQYNDELKEHSSFYLRGIPTRKFYCAEIEQKFLKNRLRPQS